MSEAAIKLGVNTSTVSRKLNELEKECGLKLLSRSTRKIEETEEGKLVYRYCEILGEGLDELSKELVESKDTPSGKLTISLPHTASTHPITELIYQFSNAYPEVIINLKFSPPTIDFNDHSIDVWLTTVSDIHERAIVQELLTSPRSLYASPSYLKTHPVIESVADLVPPHKQIKVNGQQGHSAKSVLIELPYRMETNNPLASVLACVNGLGLAFVSPYFAKPWIDEGAIVPVLENELISQLTLKMIYRESILQPKRLKAFLDFIRTQSA